MPGLKLVAAGTESTPGRQHHRGMNEAVPNLLGHPQAIMTRHFNVAHHDVGRGDGHSLEARLRGGR